MSSPSEWIPHIISFLDLSHSQTQHDASLDKIASLIKADMLTLEDLVREMETYLTTTDAVVRARGILLLAQVLTFLVLKPLTDAAIQSLISFFTSRLADWQALHGALIGCLALIRRSSSVGKVLELDARNATQAFLENLQVQALAQEDRKLCFELLESLLSLYPNALKPLGENLVDGVCLAIDEEKDPWCLLHCFHIVELLVDLFPDPSGPVATASKDIFELLSRYFPIYFTHAKTDEFVVKREELSRALMHTLSYTPLFEPFCIPMLLEKLASSLKTAKLDALKYISACAKTYGPERMSKHAKSIWLSLKEIIFTSLQEPKASSYLEWIEKTEYNATDEVTEALMCLASCILVCDVSKEILLPLVVHDGDMMMIFNSITKDDSQYMSSEKRLYTFASILSSSAKVSLTSCTRIFQVFFPPLMDAVGISTRGLLLDTVCDGNHTVSCKMGFGALYLCTELLTAARQWAVDLASQNLQHESFSSQDDWFHVLHKFAEPLTLSLRADLLTSISVNMATVNQAIEEEDKRGVYIVYPVRCLQMLATFPGRSPISRNMSENVMGSLVLVITEISTEMFLLQNCLKGLVQIGMFLEKFSDSERRISYKRIVIERLLLWLGIGDSVPLSLKLEVVCEIGSTCIDFGLRTLEGLEAFLYTNLVEALVKVDPHRAKITEEVLGCLSKRVLPWLQEKGCDGEVYLLFFENLWLNLDAIPGSSVNNDKHGLLDALMVVMSLLVSYCTEAHQGLMVQKSYTFLLTKTSFLCRDQNNISSDGMLEISNLAPNSDILCSNDKWIVSLLASVIIALRPHVLLPDAKMLLKIFTFSATMGLEAAARALASMINKWPMEFIEDAAGTCSLEEAMNFVLGIFFQNIPWNNQEGTFQDLNSSLNIFAQIDIGREHFLDTHEIIGLAWVAKGLLMRGHEMFKNVAILLLCCLSMSRRVKDLTLDNSLESSSAILFTISKCVADSFHIITSDSENSLNKSFHASIRPLYKQRFFSFIFPLISQVIKEFDQLSFSKSMLYRAFGHVICNTPIAALLSESDKIIPFLLDGLCILNEEEPNKNLIYSLLLVLSGMLVDDCGKGAMLDNVAGITTTLVQLVAFPYLMIVRETAIQCLVAITMLPRAKIYPYRRQVLKAVKKALDDRKRSVRQEAARCHQAWLCDGCLDKDGGYVHLVY